jgi:hypothetical protein
MRNASREMEPGLVIISFPNVVFVIFPRLLLGRVLSSVIPGEGKRLNFPQLIFTPHPSFHPSDAERIARDGTQLGNHQLPQRRLR